MSSNDPVQQVDAVIVGGGFAGLYATHRLRNIQGLTVQSFDAGSGPGGTWYWNRYPGARCDIESIYYSYSFDEDLQREWRWTERFAAQPEILAYLNHVADRYDLRRSYEFDTRVTSGVWSDADKLWTVTTDTGRTVRARFLIGGTGGLSVAKNDDFPGLADFKGEVYHTSSWPEHVDLTGKRVAVIGTGSTGIQIVQEVSRVASQLIVFQRTANFACPIGNRPTTDEEWKETLASYADIRKKSRTAYGGLPYPPALPSALAVDEKTRREVYDKYYNGGGFRMVTSTFNDILFNLEANNTLADYIREKIRERVKDPEVARILTPGDDHPYGTKRAPFETNYYEAFNRDNVKLVDVKAAPIQTITPRGLRTSAGEYEFDVLILATGFDALTGPLIALNLVGRDGVRFADAWAHGPRSYLGLAAPGFPNFFTIVGPQSPSVLSNFPVSIQEHVDWVGDAITALRERGASTFEAAPEAAETWTNLVNGIAACTLYPLAKSSWYMGANIPGKARTVLLFLAGLPLYNAILGQVAGTGYGGFSIDGKTAPMPGLLELDAAMAALTGGMMIGDTGPLENAPLEVLRGLLGGILPAPERPSVRAVNTSYSSDGHQLPARIFVPTDKGNASLPVVVYLHGGGWIAGNIDAAAATCRALAAELGAVVISPSYRLAPEHPFPAAIHDTLAAVAWAAEVAGEHGGDKRRLAIVGESAGGTLAAIAAQQLRDAGGPLLAAEALIYPPIDPQASAPSRQRYQHGPILSVPLLTRMWNTYLGDPANGQSPLANPGKAKSLKGLPPTLVVTVELDPTRDESEDYARRLADAGVTTKTVRISGLAHGTFTMPMFVPRAAEMLDAVVAFLRSHLTAPQPADSHLASQKDCANA